MSEAFPTRFGQAESLLGEALRGVPSLRDRMVLATKAGVAPHNLLRKIDEGAQARAHVAVPWIIEAISGIRGRPLAQNFNQPA